jgi:tetratricopeptide (TPR) repeat protein
MSSTTYQEEVSITSSSELVALIDGWNRSGRGSGASVGPSVDLSVRRAVELRRRLEAGEPLELNLDNAADAADLLFAACRALSDECANAPTETLATASALWESLNRHRWMDDELGERETLLCSLAFIAWRSARMVDLSNAPNWEANYRTQFQSSIQWDITALECTSGNPSLSDELVASGAAGVFQVLLCLQELYETIPRVVSSKAAAVYEALTADQVASASDVRPFLLGLSARIAGTGNRIIGMYEEASRWLDLAESHFRSDLNPAPELARVSYQRLALFYMLGQYELIIKGSAALESSLYEFSLHEDVVKCRILWAASLKCIGECEKAFDVLEPVRTLAGEVRPALSGWVLMELGDLSLISSGYERGFQELAEAERLLREANQITGLTLTLAMMGFGYRMRGMFQEAIQFFTRARAECTTLDSEALDAYVRLLISETYLAMGNWRAAERELLGILPVFERHGMVAEGVAGVTLLREAVRQRRLEPGKLREFRERFGPRW